MRTRRSSLLAAVATVTVLALAVSCASVGGGDPKLVRAEDLLSNSIAVYDAAMRVHYASSKSEPVAVYQKLERVRVAFPPAWKALYDGTRAYKVNRDEGQLLALMAAVQAMVDDLAGAH